MILIDNIFVEESILSTSFCCHLNKCLGACCIEGESGAPLADKELLLIEESYTQIQTYLPEKNKKILQENGLYVKDSDDDWTTPLMYANGPCAFVVYENNIALCAIEKAYTDKKISWQKPASCHLYPIRVNYKKGFVYLRYHEWEVCQPALKNGTIPLFRFLKTPLIRYFGESFYNQLEAIYVANYQKSKL